MYENDVGDHRVRCYRSAVVDDLALIRGRADVGAVQFALARSNMSLYCCYVVISLVSNPRLTQSLLEISTFIPRRLGENPSTRI